MSALRYTLLTDGPSDRCLIWIINWRLSAIADVATLGFIPQLADLRHVASKPKLLADRMHHAIVQYPCDILFVHRDAENESHEFRVAEIRDAAAKIAAPHVPIVPVRMTEAWLLLDETAIRIAADNPNGDVSLNLPAVSSLERLVDPKKLLFDLLLRAAQKSGRRKDQFERDIPQRRQRVAELIHDFAPLRRLLAFQAFETDLCNAVHVWVTAAS